jgi:RNA polymerase sigma factor (sigma-70 family)
MPPTETTTDTPTAPRELRPRPSRAEVEPAALALIRRHGGEVLAVARRWADSPEDAEDAYQRGLEILLTKAPSTDPEHLVPWLKTVVKREAWAIRRQRERHTPSAPESEELDGMAPGSAHDQAVRIERLQLGAEAMRKLKPQEARALMLKAEGLSYREICEETGWTYTKVNRCLSEGRRRFHDRLAGIESGAECERLAPHLSALADGEARAEDMAALRPHLRTCLVCRARLRDYRAVPARVAAVAPPVVLGGSLLDAAREPIHAATGWLSDRLAALAVRWQGAAELALAHKGVAVVASAAVLGGSGVATVATVADGEPVRPAASAPAPGGSIQRPPLAPPRAAAPVPDDRERDRAAPAQRDRAATRRDEPDTARTKRAPAPSPRAESAGEFTPDSPPAVPATREPQPQPPDSARPEPSAGSGGGGEFAP